VVEAFGVCPFAAGARRADAVARRVLADTTPAEVALLIFPSLALGPAEFDRFCQPLRQADRAFVAAVFHPQTSYSLESPAQAVGFFRRAPDPMLQLLRADGLEAVRNAAPGGKFLFDWSATAWAELWRRQEKVPVTDKIAADNFQLLVGGQLARLQAILDNIAADRARSYK
jgi:hypothetical protein